VQRFVSQFNFFLQIDFVAQLHDKLPGCGRIPRPHPPAFAEVSGALTNQKISDAIN
jgi:hypothetical protein